MVGRLTLVDMMCHVSVGVDMTDVTVATMRFWQSDMVTDSISNES